MKKLMVFAMAAMVALASCSKTELVDNSAPTPISFKAVTGSVTKGGAVTPNDDFDYTLGVIAYNNTDRSEYFENAEFTKKTGTVTYWDGGKYWPIMSSLDFIVYSPYQENDVDAINQVVNQVDTKTLSVTIADNSSTQTDYMYGSAYITNKNKESGDISVTLKHALSLINIEFEYDDQIITIESATLNNTIHQGTYTVTYGQQTSVNWSGLGNAVQTLPLDDETSYMVIPGRSTSITINYSIKGMTGNALSHTINLNETWVAGTQYTYTINISANAIKFTPEVGEWTTGSTTTDTTIE